MSKESKLRIRPVIEDGEITHVEIGYEALPLRRPIPLVDFPAFVQLIEKLSDYVDFEGSAGWTTDDVIYFLFSGISANAFDFFFLLAEKGDWVRRDVVHEQLKIKGRALAGILSSPARFFTSQRKDPLYERKKFKKEGDKKSVPYYRILPKYLPLIQEVLGIGEEE